MIEPLEYRTLLAALNVAGTSSADKIGIKQVDETITVKNNGSAPIKTNGANLKAGKSRSFTDVTAITVNASSGNDRVTVDNPVTVSVTIAGGDGNDTLQGGQAADSISGGNGNDSLNGGRGDDRINGGADNDKINGADGNDTINGDAPSTTGADTIFGGLGSDSLNGGPGGDVIYGDDNDGDLDEDGSDTLLGGDGIDYLNGNGAADSVDAGAGDDFLGNIDGVIDTLDGGDGNDRSEGIFTDNDLDPNTSIEDQAALLTVSNINGPVGLFIDGTDGADTISVQSSNDEVTVNFNGVAITQSIPALQQLLDELEQGFGSVPVIIVRSAGGDDQITFSGSGPLNFRAEAGDGSDTIIGGVANERIFGGPGNDSVVAGGGNDFVAGGDDVDQIFGNDGADTIDGDGNNQQLSGDSDDSTPDTVNGGPGQDVIAYDNRSEGFAANLVDGLVGEGDALTSMEGIRGGDGNDTLTGDEGDNFLYGGDDFSFGEDLLLGLGGNDTLASVANNDTFNGGDGQDVVDLSVASADLVIMLGVTSNFIDIEHVIGGNGDDEINGDASNNSLTGGDGDDTLNGGDGNDFLFPGEGINTVSGAAGVDVVDRSDATGDLRITLDNIENDGVVGATTENYAADLENIIGGSGNDSLIGNNANQTIVGNAGNDTLGGGVGTDCLSGGNGNDFLIGGAGNDELHGRAGRDSLRGGAGSDELFGEEDEDTGDYSDHSTNVIASLNGLADDGTPGAESDNLATDIENIIGGTGNDSLSGDSGSNSLRGGLGNDTLVGNSGADQLFGGDGNDQLRGGSGNDILRGESGADDVRGDKGNDKIFNLDGFLDSITGGAGTDTADLAGSDGDILTSIEKKRP